jgi:diphthine-ammonia ligase
MDLYAISWSGGKDSCMALWKARQQGINIVHLVNFINTDTTMTMSHGLQDKSIVLQAEALGLPLLQQKVTWDTYEAGFKESMKYLKHRGITGLVTGDIYLLENRDWIERVCGESGIEASRPLWNMDPLQLITEFIQDGFKAVVVNARTDLFDKERVGSQVDKKFIDDLQQLAREKQIDICGEAGEFHTFVYDGPVFNKSIHMGDTSLIHRGDRWFLQVTDFSLSEKAQ